MAVEVTLEDAKWMVGRAGLSEVASVQRLPGGGGGPQAGRPRGAAGPAPPLPRVRRLPAGAKEAATPRKSPEPGSPKTSRSIEASLQHQPG